MARLTITMTVKDHDHLTPLALGDVQPDGIDLRLVRDTPFALQRSVADPEVQAGELSFSRYLIGLAQGDRSLVGIPVFPERNYRHRCFFIRRGSPFQALPDLAGKRIGTNEWPATGNTWSRAALRDQGVRLETIEWRVGPVDDSTGNATGGRPPGALPPNARALGPDQNLRDMLLAGELDALMCPSPPAGFYAPDSPIVRLYPDYRRVEQEYARRVGMYPAHHIAGIRRGVFERHPWAARSLYDALEESRRLWLDKRMEMTTTSPWLLADLEDAAAVLGPDWAASGVAPNRRMIAALCVEELAQALVQHPINPDTVFADFEAAAA